MELKPLLDIIEEVQSINTRYRTCKLSLTHDQAEILRDLSVCYSDLVIHKIEAKKQWLNSYNSAKGTNAAKEREADTLVQDYDLITYLLRAVDNQIQSIRSTIGAFRN